MKVIEQLKAILTPEQFASLPGVRRWITPDRDAMTTSADRLGGKGGAGDKIEAMRTCGIAVADSPASLGSTLAELLG